MTGLDRQTPAPRDIFEVLLRHRWWLILPAFAVAASVLALGLVLPRKYRGQAIFERRTDIVLTEIVNHGTAVNAQDPRTALVEEIIGQPAADSLRARFRSLPADPALAGFLAMDPQALAGEITRHANVSFDINSPELDRIRLDYIGDDPVVTRALANGLVESFIERTRSSVEQRLRQTLHFLQNEVQNNRTLVDQAESRRLSFEISHGELLPDQPSSVVSQLPEAQAALTALRLQRDSARARLVTLREQRSLATDSAESPPPDASGLEQKLHAQRAQLEQMVGTQQMTDMHPAVRQLRAQIAATEADLHDAARELAVTNRPAGPKPAELDLLLASASADLQAVEQQLARAQSRADNLQAQALKVFPVRSDYLKLNRDVDDTRHQLGLWEENLHRVEMALTAETGKRGVQLDFVRPCPVLVRPVSPNLTQLVGAAIGLSLLAAGIVGFYLCRSDTICPRPDDLAAACGLRLYGAVGRIVSRRQRILTLARNLILQPLAITGLAVMILILGGLLRLQLDQPTAFAQWRRQPAQFLHLVSSATSPSRAGARE
jgi:uncharacterized protein involved in exopolysaccharide biosynthesis